MKTAKLLLHCPDKPGILAEVTDFITVNKGNIIYLDQYVDHVVYILIQIDNISFVYRNKVCHFRKDSRFVGTVQ